MKLNELLLDFLQEEGYRPQVDPEDGEITFKCEGLTYSYFPDENDDQYFRLMLPAIYDVTEDNRIAVLEAVNEVNKVYKVAKVMVVRDSVWIATEMLMDTTPVLEDFIPRLLNIMVGARKEFYDQIEG